MTTKQGIILGVLVLTELFCNGQTIATTALTSGGLDAGTNAPANGGNTFYGYKAGNVNSNSAGSNTFIGDHSGSNNTTGNTNTYVGAYSGIANPTGSNNIALGLRAGQSIGNYNIFIGNDSGAEEANTGNGNIYIGHTAGWNDASGGNKLIIDNGFFPQESYAPLIYGDFANDLLKFHGKVGIGGGGISDTPFGNFPTTAGSIDVSNYRLFVKGGMLTEEVRVSLKSTWADYVFKKDYKLPTIQEVEKQIQEKGHLFNLPSAKQVKEDGIELGEMARMQQEKIEELTLYLIQQNKEIEVLKTQVKTLLNAKK